MQLDVISVGSFQKKISVTVPPDEVRTELEKAYRDVARRARLPGFRPGKAPRKVLEARFGPQIESDVQQVLIQKGYSDALDQHRIEPVGRPEVDHRGDLDERAAFEFSITVDVKPQITLSTYTGVDVVWPRAEADDAEVDRLVRARLEGEARLVSVDDRPAVQGDLVMVELVARDGETVVSSEPGTMIRTESDPYYPGVEAVIVGMSIGEEKTATIAFPETARIGDVAGRTLDVTVKVMQIQANEIPELTDALATDLGYEGGAAGMRLALAAQLTKTRESAARNQARANLLQALIDANPFDVPTGMVEQQLTALIEELRLQAAYAGRNPKSLRFDDAQLADLRIRAEFAVKGGLILEFVSEKETLVVTDADLDAKYQELADERGQTVEAIRGYFVKDDAVEELRGRLLEEKTLDWLLEHSNILADGAAPAPKAAAPEAESAAAGDLSLLGEAVGKIKEALGTGAHDAQLAELLAAEQGGKARKGVISAIEARIAQIAG